MTIEEVIKSLIEFNQWRRDNTGKLNQPNPTHIGKTIDEAIKLLKKQLKTKKT